MVSIVALRETKAWTRNSAQRPLVFGHRGTRRGAPENTLGAMRLCLTQGADGVEIDVRTCATGEVIVLHDPDLSRITGTAEPVASMPWSSLASIDLGGGERILRLDQALELILGGGKLLNLELKADVPDPDALVAAVARCVEARPKHELEHLLLSSFSARVCRAVRSAIPGAAVAWILDRAEIELPAGIAAIHPHHSLVDAPSLEAWRADALAVNVWTVNQPEIATALAAMGVDGLITDDVPLVLQALAR